MRPRGEETREAVRKGGYWVQLVAHVAMVLEEAAAIRFEIQKDAEQTRRAGDHRIGSGV